MKTKVTIERDGKIFYTIRSRYIFNAIMMDKGVCLEFLSDATKTRTSPLARAR